MCSEPGQTVMSQPRSPRSHTGHFASAPWRRSSSPPHRAKQSARHVRAGHSALSNPTVLRRGCSTSVTCQCTVTAPQNPFSISTLRLGPTSQIKLPRSIPWNTDLHRFNWNVGIATNSRRQDQIATGIPPADIDLLRSETQHNFTRQICWGYLHCWIAGGCTAHRWGSIACAIL